MTQLWVQRLGWALLHFLWQGTAIAIAFAILRRLLARSLAAQGRYLLACIALAAMTAAPALTFLMVAAPERGQINLGLSVSAAEWQRFLPGVVALWLAGVLVFSLRLLGAWRFTARLRAMAHPASSEWQQTVERIAASIGAPQRVRLLISSMVDVPTVIGWLRRVILMPVEFFTGLPVEHIKALLAHEIAHIRRLDYLASLLQSIAEAVLFYHPAVWWISEQIRAERELCCDDIAVTVGGDVFIYASALAELESRQPSLLKPALAANGGSLVNRIRRLIEPELARARGNNLPGPGAAWAMILLWIAGVGVSAVHAAQTPVVVPVPVTLSPDPLPALASHARNTLLFDPFLSAQLQQPAPPREAAGDGDRAQKEAAPRKELEIPWQKWLNEDVVYIITDEERNAFKQPMTDEEREQFVEQFWLRRDPTPDTVENEMKEEHYRRIAYANQHFAWTSPGWKSDRGRIYITFGPPDQIETHPGGGAAKAFAFEDWHYPYLAGIGNNLWIEFADPKGSGEYVMTANPLSGHTTQPGTPAAAGNQFERLQQFALLQRTPQVKFGDSADAIGKLATYETLPMQIRVDYLRVTGSSVLANITIRFEARDLKSDRNNGKSTVTIIGQVSTIARRPVATFEKTDATDGQQGLVYAESVPLAPGPYRLKILARDAISARIGTYEVALDVPQFDEGKLASSSLILADTVERMPVNSLPTAMFTIGDTTVRPRPGDRFTSDEKLGIYLQLYNFRPDATAGKLSGSIEHEIDNAGTNEKVLDFSEEAGSIANASSSQVTIEKLVSLKTFQPGAYTLKVTATDRIGNQTVRQQGNFTVSAAAYR